MSKRVSAHRHQQVAAFRQEQPGQVRWVNTGRWWTIKHDVKSFSSVLSDRWHNPEVWGLSDTFKLTCQVIWINTDLKCSMCFYWVQTQPCSDQNHLKDPQSHDSPLWHPDWSIRSIRVISWCWPLFLILTFPVSLHWKCIVGLSNILPLLHLCVIFIS